MPNFIHTKANDQLLAFLTFLFVVSNYLLGANAYGGLVLLGITLLFLVLSNFKFQFEPFHLFVLQFILYCYATSMWAYNYRTALTMANTLMELLICLSVMYWHFKRFRDVTQLMNIMMWAGYVVVIYSYFYYGVTNVAVTGEDNERLGNTFNNINTLSMLAATVVVINFFFFFFRKASWLMMVLVLIAVVFVFRSESRKSLFIVAFGVLFLYFLKYMRAKKRSLAPFLKFFGFFVLFVAILFALSKTALFEGAANRFMGMVSWFTGEGEVDASTELRMELRDVGWEQFRKTPWLGIGMNCSQYLASMNIGERMYLHDNYAEMACNGGIFGLISYYCIFGYLFLQERKYLKVDDMANLVFTLIVIRFITDMGAVSYFTKVTYLQLMIYFLHLESCKIKYPQIK